MANINLLPDDFRQREQKEIKKASRFSKDLGVEFSSGVKSKSTGTDQDKPSFWTRLFGTGSPKQAQVNRHSQAQGDTEHVVAKEAPKTLPVHTETKAVYQPRTTRWADILGTGVLKPATRQSYAAKDAHHLIEKIQQPITADKKQSVETPKTNYHQKDKSAKKSMGWWQIIRSIFVPQHVSEPAVLQEIQKKEQHVPVKSAHEDLKLERKDKNTHSAPKNNKLRIDVNLIPQELLLKKHWSPRAQVFFVILAVVIPGLLVAGVYLGIAQLQRTTDRDIAFERQRMNQITTVVATLHKRQAMDRHLEQKLLAINNLMKQHIRWSKFFNKLEKYTLDGVYYTDIKADVSGELVLPAVAPNYEVAAQQLVALREATDFVSDAQVNAMQILTDSKKGVVGVSFNLKIVLRDDVLVAQ